MSGLSRKTGPQPTAPPPPAPPVIQYETDEDMHTVVSALMGHHDEHGVQAVRHENEVARLDAEIASMRAALEDKMGQREREDRSARQRRGAEEAFGRAVAASGAPFPARVQQLPGQQAWPPANGQQQPIEGQAAMAARAGFEPYQQPGPNGTQHLPDPLKDHDQALVDKVMGRPREAAKNPVWDDVEYPDRKREAAS